jgi:hypothetical protein
VNSRSLRQGRPNRFANNRKCVVFFEALMVFKEERNKSVIQTDLDGKLIFYVRGNPNIDLQLNE